MSILKKVGLVLVSPVFVFLLFATALDVGFVRTATHPQTVKDLVAQSGVYKTIVPNILSQNGDISTALGNISTSDQQIKAAVTSAITPDVVKNQTDTAIDGIYSWLDGKTAQPNFSFGLAGEKERFADSISSVAEQRLQGLPACDAAQNLQIIRTGSFDVLNATCRPAGISAAAGAQTVKAATLGSDYLNKANINAADIKDSTGQPIFQTKLKDAPKRYQQFKKTPFVLIILTILAGIGVIFLSSTWQKGLRHAGITVLFSGLLMLVFAWGLNKGINESLPKLNLDNAVLESSINNIVKEVGHKIADNYKLFGFIYSVIGIAAAGTGHYLIRRGRGEEQRLGPAADVEGGREDPGYGGVDAHRD